MDLWDAWLASHSNSKEVAVRASAELALSLSHATAEERHVCMRWLSLVRDPLVSPGVEMWLSTWSRFLAVQECARVASSKAFLMRAVAEREPTLEETIIGSGWLSHELPNYPTLRWSGGPYGTWDEHENDAASELVIGPPTFNDEPIDAQTYPPHRLEAWREDYLDFCEIVRDCAPRRQRLGLPPVDRCSRWAPCGKCRYHPGALLPSAEYWRDLDEGEIDRLIRQREDERNLRDETILRARARRRARLDWNWPRTRSQSPDASVQPQQERDQRDEDVIARVLARMSPRTRAGPAPRSPPRSRSRSPQVGVDAIRLWLHGSDPHLPVSKYAFRARSLPEKS